MPSRVVVYRPAADGGVAETLGTADYSYGFVLEAFLPLLRECTDVTLVQDPAELTELPPDTVVLSFAPPHATPRVDGLRLVPVFAWEFDTIPNFGWDDDPYNDWRLPLGRSAAAITHAAFTADVTRAAVGSTLDIAVLPAPVWDAHQPLALTDRLADQPRTLTWRGGVADSAAVQLAGRPAPPEVPVEEHDCQVTLQGTVFTYVFNPFDSRKNWYDLITAFAWAFRDDPEATLVLKAVQADTKAATETLLLEMWKLAPYRCRIVVIVGYLEPTEYQTLIEATTFAVNSSRGEGQCLPLMEFMSAGCPAVAPPHTGMADYVNASNAHLVRSSREPTHWPRDPRLKLTTHRERIYWDSLVDGLRAAARTARNPEKYREMSRAATDSCAAHCSRRVVLAGLRQFLASLDSSVAAGV